MCGETDNLTQRQQLIELLKRLSETYEDSLDDTEYNLLEERIGIMKQIKEIILEIESKIEKQKRCACSARLCPYCFEIISRNNNDCVKRNDGIEIHKKCEENDINIIPIDTNTVQNINDIINIQYISLQNIFNEYGHTKNSNYVSARNGSEYNYNYLDISRLTIDIKDAESKLLNMRENFYKTDDEFSNSVDSSDDN